jgi:hypothetical protein
MNVITISFPCFASFSFLCFFDAKVQETQSDVLRVWEESKTERSRKDFQCYLNNCIATKKNAFRLVMVFWLRFDFSPENDS